MRAGGNMRGGAREKRMMGHINRAMDRTHESVLHRTRGSLVLREGRLPGPGWVLGDNQER